MFHKDSSIKPSLQNLKQHCSKSITIGKTKKKAQGRPLTSQKIDKYLRQNKVTENPASVKSENVFFDSDDEDGEFLETFKFARTNVLSNSVRVPAATGDVCKTVGTPENSSSEMKLNQPKKTFPTENNLITLQDKKSNAANSDCVLKGTSEFCADMIDKLPLLSSSQLKSVSHAKDFQVNDTCCPICLKTYHAEQTNAFIGHLKNCSSKNKISMQQLLTAFRLQKKQCEERITFGLPAVSDVKLSAPRRTATKKGSQLDTGLQLALALSASLKEAEEARIEKETECLVEAGLEDEAVEHYKQLENVTDNTNNLGQVENKWDDSLLLLSRSGPEKKQRMAEKISAILSDLCCIDKEENQLFVSSKITSPLLKCFIVKITPLWNVSHQLDDNGIYLLPCFAEYISQSTDDGVAACEQDSRDKLYTYQQVSQEQEPVLPNSELEKIINQLLCDSEQRQKCSGQSESVILKDINSSATRKSKMSSKNCLSDDWSRILNNSRMSDVTIFTRDDEERTLAGHKLVFFARCGSILNDVITEEAGNVSNEMIVWTDYSYNTVYTFLEAVYTGYMCAGNLSEEERRSLFDMCERYNFVNYEASEVIKNNPIELKSVDKDHEQKELENLRILQTELKTQKLHVVADSDVVTVESSAEPNSETGNNQVQTTIIKFEPVSEISEDPKWKDSQDEIHSTRRNSDQGGFLETSNLKHYETNEVTKTNPTELKSVDKDHGQKEVENLRILQTELKTQKLHLVTVSDVAAVELSVEPNCGTSDNQAQAISIKTEPISEISEEPKWKDNEDEIHSTECNSSHGELLENCSSKHERVPDENNSIERTENSSSAAMIVLPSEKSIVNDSIQSNEINSNSVGEQSSLSALTACPETNVMSNCSSDSGDSLVFSDDDNNGVRYSSFVDLEMDELVLTSIVTESNVVKRKILSPPCETSMKRLKIVTDSSNDLTVDKDVFVENNRSFDKSIENSPARTQTNTVISDNSTMIAANEEPPVKDEDEEIDLFPSLTQQPAIATNSPQNFTVGNDVHQTDTAAGIDGRSRIEYYSQQEAYISPVWDGFDDDIYHQGYDFNDYRIADAISEKSDECILISSDAAKASSSLFMDESPLKLSNSVPNYEYEEMILTQKTPEPAVDLNSSPLHLSRRKSTDFSTDRAENTAGKGPKCSGDSNFYDNSFLFSCSVLDQIENDRRINTAYENKLPVTPTSVRNLKVKSKSESCIATPSSKIYSTAEGVTPLPNYSIMKTVELKKELDKYGLKPTLGKKKSKLLLRHIYNELHPIVTDDETSDCENEIKVKKKSLLEEFNKQTQLKYIDSSSSNSDIISLVSDSELSGDNLSLNSGSEEDGYFIEELNPCSQFSKSQTVSIEVGMKKLMQCDVFLHKKILLYEPISVEQLKSSLKEVGVKCNLNNLIDYLDEQCITYRFNNRSFKRQNGKRKKRNEGGVLSQNLKRR